MVTRDIDTNSGIDIQTSLDSNMSLMKKAFGIPTGSDIYKDYLY